MPLSKKQVKDVCLLTNRNAAPEDMCRYCYHDNVFVGLGWNCVKLYPSSMKRNAEAEIHRQVIAGDDPRTIPYSGDNCKGYLYLLHIKQGYDV